MGKENGRQIGGEKCEREGCHDFNWCRINWHGDSRRMGHGMKIVIGYKKPENIRDTLHAEWNNALPGSNYIHEIYDIFHRKCQEKMERKNAAFMTKSSQKMLK